MECGILRFVNAAAKSPKQILIFNDGLLTANNSDSCSVTFPIKKLLNAEIFKHCIKTSQMLVETKKQTNNQSNSDLTSILQGWLLTFNDLLWQYE